MFFKNSLISYSKDALAISIDTQLTLTDESIFISYRLTGDDLKTIDLGDGHPKRERIKGLWTKTCFELFIKNDKDEYIEFNFSPIFEWNSFFFHKKGDELKEYAKITSLKTDILLSHDIFQLIVEIKKSTLPDGFFQSSSMNAGITSVIKNKKNEISYWALSHEDTKPNFHHFDSFKCRF